MKKVINILNQVLRVVLCITIFIVVALNLFYDKKIDLMPLVIILLLESITKTKVSIKECKCDKKVVKENNNN